jgi:transporter family protein
MLSRWLVYAIASLLLWGFWGFVLGFASRGLKWWQLYVFSGLGTVIGITAITAIYKGSILSAEPRYIVLGIIAGLLGTTGYLAMIGSLEAGGDASIVVPLTSLYPAITVILSALVLREEISLEKAIGVTLALIAIYLLSKT